MQKNLNNQMFLRYNKIIYAIFIIFAKINKFFHILRRIFTPKTHYLYGKNHLTK